MQFGWLASRFHFAAHSPELIQSGGRGQTPIDLLVTIRHRGCVAVASDLAKANAALIAMLASAGLITTETVDVRGEYGRLWRLTALGVGMLENHS